MMSRYRDTPSRTDRAKAIAAVVAVHAGLAALIIIGPRTEPEFAGHPSTQLIDIALPPPPPPPPPAVKPAPRPEREQGAAGKKAEPSPVVAPPPRLPARTPVPAAPVAGTGSASTAGAATTGTGPGAGGSGAGGGGGGSGGGGGIGTDVRLLGGNSARLPARLLRQFTADRGYAHLWLTIAETGRVTDCSVLQSTGDAKVDQALCGLMVRQSRWTAARDTQGRPITVKVRYTATWSKD
jgi:periplasmic protein TonB